MAAPSRPLGSGESVTKFWRRWRAAGYPAAGFTKPPRPQRAEEEAFGAMRGPVGVYGSIKERLGGCRGARGSTQQVRTRKELATGPGHRWGGRVAPAGGVTRRPGCFSGDG